MTTTAAGDLDNNYDGDDIDGDDEDEHAIAHECVAHVDIIRRVRSKSKTGEKTVRTHASKPEERKRARTRKGALYKGFFQEQKKKGKKEEYFKRR